MYMSLFEGYTAASMLMNFDKEILWFYRKDIG